VLDFADLYVGKLAAALSRQHPRDPFDKREAPDFNLIGLPQAAELPGIRRKLANLGQRSAAKRAAAHKQLSTILGNYSDTTRRWPGIAQIYRKTTRCNSRVFTARWKSHERRTPYSHSIISHPRDPLF
jgi:hypothetical protein